MDIVISILLVIVGLIIGWFLNVIFNSLRENNANKKVDAIIEKAKKDAEKTKRDLLEKYPKDETRLEELIVQTQKELE